MIGWSGEAWTGVLRISAGQARRKQRFITLVPPSRLCPDFLVLFGFSPFSRLFEVIFDFQLIHHLHALVVA